MKNSILAFTFAAVALVGSLDLQAGVTTDLTASLTQSGASLNGYVTTVLTVNTSIDFTSSSILLSLNSGNIYNSGTGSDYQAPSASNDLAYDTYISANNGGVMTVVTGATPVGGSSSPSWSSSLIDISANNFVTTDVGAFTIGQFTLSDDANGTFSIRVSNRGTKVGSGYTPDFFYLTGTIENGHFVLANVPEPASVGLLGIAGLGLLLKRRK